MPADDQKIHTNRYKVVPRTLVFLFDSTNRVLLIKGSSNKRLWSGLYNGIGGHIEVGENIQEAAVRELKEETGIINCPLQFCGQIMVDVTPETGVSLFIFRGTYQDEVIISSSEGELTWIPLDAIENLRLVEDLPRLIPLVAAHQPDSPVIIGKYSYDQEGKLRISLI